MLPREEIKDYMVSLNCKRDLIVFSHKVVEIIPLTLALRCKMQQSVSWNLIQESVQESEKAGDLQDIILFPVVHATEGQEISLPPAFFFFESAFPCGLPQVLG